LGYWANGHYYRNRLEYCGSGEWASQAAALDVEERELDARERQQKRELEQAERIGFQAARQRAARVDLVLCRGLTAAGFWRQRRHQWRRRAVATEIQPQTVETAVVELAELPAITYLMAITRDQGLQQRLEAKLRSLRTELIGNGPESAALRLAVNAAILAWLDTWFCELLAARDPGRTNLTLERRRTWSSRRYALAVTTVERIRRLTRPRGPRVAIQVNQAAALELVEH
jgi:hypothetical protein